MPSIFKTKKVLPYVLMTMGFFAFSFPYLTEASTLHIFPTESVLEVGSERAQSVLVSTDQAINAVSGVISFPNDLVEVLDIRVEDSIIDFWVSKPSFSNTEGRIRFEGVILNPGYRGSAGEIFRVRYRATNEGQGAVRFTSGATLLNDGRGTNSLEGYGNSFFEVSTQVPSLQERGIPADASLSPFSLEISEIAPDRFTDPYRSFEFSIQTGSPGVDFYEIRIDDGEYEIWYPSGGEEYYTTPPLLPGAHILTVTAVDRNEDILTDSEVFIIEALPPVVFGSFPERIYMSGSTFFCNLLNNFLMRNKSCDTNLVFEGQAPPRSLVHLVFFGNDDNVLDLSATAGPGGYFSIPFPGDIDRGTYEVYAYAADERGARTAENKVANISFENPTAVSYGSTLGSYLLLAVILIGIIVGLWYFYHRHMIGRLRLQREVFEAERILQRRFEGIEKDVSKLHDVAERLRNKGELSAEESAILTKLEEEIRKSEEEISREIEDIDKFDN